MQQDPDLEAIAYHEAGHAVIAWVCDHMLGEVTIHPDPEQGILGRVQHADQGSSDLFELGTLAPHPDTPGGWVVRTGETTARHLTEDERHWLELNDRLSPGGRGTDAHNEAEVMIAAAGQEAQRKFDPGSVEPHQSAGDWDDAYECLERLTVLREETADTIRTDLIKRTVEVLTDPLVWQVVTAIAKGLLKSETLKSQEVTTIIRQTVCRV